MPGPRIYSIEEVDRLLPRLERIFTTLDDIKARLRTLKIRVNALEMIWGAKVHEKDNPDHLELEHHLSEMKDAEKEFEQATKQIGKLGGQVKSVEPPLVDFYGVRDGRLIFWCWTRGEEKIDHWHHVDEGFAGRQKV